MVSALIPVLSERKKTGTAGGCPVLSCSSSSATSHSLQRLASSYTSSTIGLVWQPRRPAVERLPLGLVMRRGLAEFHVGGSPSTSSASTEGSSGRVAAG